jgi:predicted site-specific integrase-resolvase
MYINLVRKFAMSRTFIYARVSTAEQNADK